ncbi:osteoclast-stimulating factor 1-like [Bradysia coprophila]|uniref:osteoclast-stimulating factor 1-like n=1 Tax=Bradysia coprophila TaxID=38358 RepID=UPI00187DB973|nr:osteoclast-stimulating factor 1-like [Bradysia coprophila]
MKLCIEALREQHPATWNDFLNAQERFGQSPLMLATRGLANDCAKLLINDYGVDLNLGNISGETALHIAVQFENVEILKLLLTKNASTDIRNYRNETAADQAEHSLNDTIKGIFPNRAKHRRDISNANVDLSLTKN